MTGLSALCLRTTGPHLEVLDQRLLPQEETWLTIKTVDEMIFAIRELALRGAPAIGVGAALALGQSARQGASRESLVKESRRLREARPTAVNLMTCLDRMNDILQGQSFSAEALATRARELFEEDVRLCERIAEHGQGLFENGDGVLTHCNTGGLATAGRGTAFGVLRKAHESGRRLHVFVDETRPLLQGGRLTAWECARHGLPHTLIADNMAAHQMARGRVQKVIVGADRIARNGDFANKIGTYGLAVLCHFHRIPFYVAAPVTTVDHDCAGGGDIPIEQRAEDEIRGARGAFGTVTWAPSAAPVDNPAFDVTPAELVDGWILDTGFFGRDAIRAGLHLESTKRK